MEHFKKMLFIFQIKIRVTISPFTSLLLDKAIILLKKLPTGKCKWKETKEAYPLKTVTVFRIIIDPYQVIQELTDRLTNHLQVSEKIDHLHIAHLFINHIIFATSSNYTRTIHSVTPMESP